MGVWIETRVTLSILLSALVTPCMGVWIETYAYAPRYLDFKVTPCMGVWIETLSWYDYVDSNFGHTLYGCVD